MRKGLKCIMDALRMAHRFDGKMLPAVAIEHALNAAAPFVGTFLTAFILDRLTAGVSFADILMPALWGIVLVFALKLVAGWLHRYQAARLSAAYWQWESLSGEKSMSLDYQQLEEPAIAQLRARMQKDRSWGSGITNTYGLFGRMVGAFVGVILSFFLLAPLLANASLFLNGYTGVFLGVAVLLTALTTWYQVAVVRGAYAAYTSSMPTGWRELWYYIRGGFHLRLGKDVRIYQAQPLIATSIANPAIEKQAAAEVAQISHKSGMGGALSGLSTACITGGAYLATALLYLTGGLTLGTVVRSASGLSQLVQGISSLMTIGSSFVVDTQRLQSKMEYLAIPTEMYRGSIPVEKRRDNDYLLEFHDVSFKYPGSDRYALRHLNLTLHVGTRMAVVGRNGSGKTTMIKLLCRLYDPTEGTITLNGIDIRKYDQEAYRRIFSVVFQDFQLFGYSLGQNVASAIDYDAGEVRASLGRAGFGLRLDDMKEGLDTPLYKEYDEDGVNISGGEAQKIALARAIYKDAPFIVLDEPTAALDPIAEFEIYSRFNEIVGEKTAIYISHRLSSCRFCQDILVFQEGRLIQRGSHEALLAQAEGQYHALWHAQAQYYTDQEAGGAAEACAL